MAKRRLDTLLLERGLAETSEKAKALVMAGQVRVGEQPVSKPGTLIDADARLNVTQSPRYVSRGGDKLEHALHAFGLDVSGVVAADIGASTGGFTHCLLQHGASRVYAIDVGKGELDYNLRNDPRVVVMEGVNARLLEDLPEPADVITLDLSFISVQQVMPVARGLLADAGRRGAATEIAASRPTSSTRATLADKPGGCCAPTASVARNTVFAKRTPAMVALFKPQFEAHKTEVPRGGVIRDAQLHATLIGRFAAWCVANGFRIVDLTTSPILGAAGNREFFFLLRPHSSPFNS